MKRIGAALTVTFVLALGCGKDVAAPPVVASVRVSPGADTLTALGDSRQYTAQARDASGRAIADRNVTWTVVDPAVASVQGSGVVEARANGTTRVRATADGVTGEAQVIVAQQVSAVIVTPGTALLAAVSDTTRFAAVARDANNNAIVDVRFVWLSENHGVATVDSAGLVRARGNGGTTITALADGVTGNAGVTVNQVPALLEFVVQPSDHQAGQPMARAVEVEVRDVRGNRVRGIRVPVRLDANGPAHAPIIGATTVTSVDGIAAFPNLSHHMAGTAYSIVANSDGLGTGVSASFNVTPGPIARLTVTAPAQVIVDSMFVLAVRGFDAYDNERLGFGVDGLELSSNPWREAQVGVNGGLEGVVISRPGDGYRIRARVGTITGETGLIGARLHLTNVSAGTYRACGLSYGRAYCWGVRLYGGLSGIIESDSIPRAAAPAALRFVQLVSGTLFTCGRSGPGDAYCWGTNPDTLAGDTVRLVSGGHQFTQLTAGSEHVCGVDVGGAVYCWGTNRDGQLGDGTKTDRPDPVLIAASGYTGVTAGERHTCALRTDATATCWGNNISGQLGIGDQLQRLIPTTHTCGMWSTTLVYCWGSNITGQLGDGGLDHYETQPKLVLLLTSTPKSSLASGGLFTCVRAEISGVHCWGANRFGEVGNGSTIPAFVPVRVIQ